MKLYTKVDKINPNLHEHHWPPVNSLLELTPEMLDFINTDAKNMPLILQNKKSDPLYFSTFLHETLSAIYAYIFGYENSITYISPNDLLEINLYKAKVILERELLDNWLEVDCNFPKNLNQQEASDYLYKLSKYNPAVQHPFFEYLRKEASTKSMQYFLYNEVTRNESVDDDVALLSTGLQGMMKNVAVANLWDECGHGILENFHTYWLRRLLEKNESWEELRHYRLSQPYFSKITSNTFNMLITRSPYKFHAFGEFMITEGFVAPHFVKIIEGLKRTGLGDEDIIVYFTSHVIVDPNHTREMAIAIKEQRPMLSQEKINQIIHGSHIAIAAATKQYDLMLNYLKRL